MGGKEKFVEISGSDAKAYDEKFTPSAKQTVKERVRKMGKAIKDGAITKFYEKKKVVVTIETSGSTCNDNVKAEFKKKIKEVSQNALASAPILHVLKLIVAVEIKSLYEPREEASCL